MHNVVHIEILQRDKKTLQYAAIDSCMFMINSGVLREKTKIKAFTFICTHFRVAHRQTFLEPVNTKKTQAVRDEESGFKKRERENDG